MPKDFQKGRWPDIREMIKSNWDLIDEEDIDHFRGKLDLLSEKIQLVYSYSKERADHEIREFKQALHPGLSSFTFVPNKNILY